MPRSIASYHRARPTRPAGDGRGAPSGKARPAIFSSELKRGSLELLILAVLKAQPRHGYEIGKLLERSSDSELEVGISTLYTVLYRLEERGWIRGRWVEKKGERRRCYYSLTREGEEVLAQQRREWRAFVDIVDRVIAMSEG